MTAFSTAIDAIFADPNMAVDAIYRASGDGDPVDVRVMRSRPDESAIYTGARFVADTIRLELRVSEVADLNVGDTFEIDGETFAVQGEPLRDAERLWWTADVVPE